MIRVALAGMLAVALAGCTAEDQVQMLISMYCDAPQSERGPIRELVNSRLAPTGHSIMITCAGDAAE